MMVTPCIDWGGRRETDYSLLDCVVQDVYNACLDNSSCEVIEIKVDDDRRTQSVIADFADGSFSIDNEAGVLRVERLALSYCPDSEFRWEVRALREDFPVTIHQNHVLEGEPRSLCLYIEPWESVERSWTPELFVKRIFWWLRATAEGTIHGDDQPIEQLFFSSHIHVLLPEGHFESEDKLKENLVFEGIDCEGVKAKTLIGRYGDGGSIETPHCLSVSVLLESIENGPIEDYPFTLGDLEDLLVRRGSSVVEPLKDAVSGHVTESGIELKSEGNEFVLVLLGIPRTRDGVVQKLEVQGFVLDSGIGYLGESLSVLFKAQGENKWYRDVWGKKDSDQWRAHSLFPVNVKCYPSKKEIRQYSGLNPDDNGPIGVLAGVGALGGLLAEIWNRECWGDWSYVDDDIVQAHNVVRHISSRSAIGYPKAVVVDSILGNTHSSLAQEQSSSFVSNIVSGEKELESAIDKSNLIVDVTTTLHVPRIISTNDNFPRTVSAFITPSGMASVMLLEDKSREVRSNSLEAQYYRALLNEDWGETHLSGHAGHQWVGAGCREVSLAMSNELIHLHAAVLSRQIRKKSSSSEARICIWEHQDNSGGMISRDIRVNPCHTITLHNWTILYDDGFLQDVVAYRRDSVPNETGGIVFGIVDQKDATITLVKACHAPENSESTTSSFSRGAYDSEEILEDCHNRTAGVVSYVGEWHSHPPNCGALPSGHDIGQLNFLSCSLQVEGMPALMMIISDDSVGYYIGCEGAVVNFTRASSG